MRSSSLSPKHGFHGEGFGRSTLSIRNRRPVSGPLARILDWIGAILADSTVLMLPPLNVSARTARKALDVIEESASS